MRTIVASVSVRAMAAVEQEQAGPVRTILLNRPEVLNAFDEAMLDAVRAALRDAVADPEVRGIVLTGGPRAFSTGEDLRVARTLDGPAFAAQIADLAASRERAARRADAGDRRDRRAGVRRRAGARRQLRHPDRGAVGPVRVPGDALGPDDHERRLAAAAPPRRRGLGAGARAAGDRGRRGAGPAHRARHPGGARRGPPCAAAAQLAGQLAALDPDAIAATKGLLNADPSSWRDVLEAERDTVVRGFSAPAVRERLDAFGRDR